MRVANFFFKELQIYIVTTSLTLTIYRISTHLCHAIRLTFRSPSRSFSNINTLLKISNPLASCSSSANIFKSFDFLLLKTDLGLSFKPRLCISLKTLDQKTFSERRSIVSFSFQTLRHFKHGSAEQTQKASPSQPSILTMSELLSTKVLSFHSNQSNTAIYIHKTPSHRARKHGKMMNKIAHHEKNSINHNKRSLTNDYLYGKHTQRRHNPQSLQSKVASTRPVLDR